MCKSFLVAACALALAAPSATAQSTNAGPRKLNVLHGPATAQLGSAARIEVPVGYVFIDGKTLRALLKAGGNPVSGDELGSLSPTNADWSVMFRFHEIGYVKDDEKDKLDPDKLLQQFREGTEAANRMRAEAGSPPIHVVGWEQPPKYNPVTHNLEWAIRGECQGEAILNYDTRLLGRKGVMQVKLIVSPEEFAATLPAFTNLLASHQFQTGESYAEYRPGDKLAKYGLAALITGGATVGAVKLGLFAWLAVFFKKAWKLVVLAVVAVAGFFKKIFSRLTGRDEQIRRED
jgi:uncharacterized membrane-anchored protein